MEPKIKTKSGWQSTKLHLSLITLGLLTAGFLLLIFRLPAGSSVDSLFGTYVMGVLGAAGIYSTTNVAATLSQRASAPQKEPPDVP